MKIVKKLMFLWIVIGAAALVTTNVAWAKEWWSEEIPFPLIGMHMVLGTDGEPYLAGVDEGGLYFASRGPGGWSREVVTFGEIDHLSLAMDSDNVPHIAYVHMEGEQRYVEHAWSSENGWTIERVASVSTIRHWHTCIATAPNGSIGVAYVAPLEGDEPGSTRTNLLFAEKGESGWTHTVVAYVPQITAFIANIVRGGLRYDLSSQPHLAYSKHYNGAMAYATRSAGIWSTEEVYYTSWGDYDGILRLDSLGQPVIGFWDWKYDGKLSWRVDGTWQTEDTFWGWRNEHNFDIDANDNVRALVYSQYLPYPQWHQYYLERDATTGTWWNDPFWPWRWTGGGLLNIEIDDNGLTHFAISTEDGPLIYGREIPAAQPDISVFPLIYDFGDIKVGTSSMTVVTISNEGNADLEVSVINLQPGSDDFAVAFDYPLPVVIPSNGTADVSIIYTPSAVGPSSGIVEIISDDPDEGYIEVSLNGTGVPEETPPEEQIAEILDFFDMSVEGGTLEGDGPGNSAQGRLGALRNMVEAAGDLIAQARYEDACGQLLDAYERCDGLLRPPDFVKGEAADDLAQMVLDLMADLECELP